MLDYTLKSALEELNRSDSAQKLFSQDNSIGAAERRYSALKEALHSVSSFDPEDNAASEALTKLELFYKEIETEFVEC